MAVAPPSARPTLLLLALVIAAYSLWQLGRALLARPGGTVCAKVRQERHVLSRAWLELDDGTWLPVYFHVGLLGLNPGDSAAGCAPSGRKRRTKPPGRLIDAPRYSPAAGAARAREVGSLRRRLTVDGAAAIAGLVPGVLWWIGLGIGPWITLPIGFLCGYWWAAIRGSDPS